MDDAAVRMELHIAAAHSITNRRLQKEAPQDSGEKGKGALRGGLIIELCFMLYPKKKPAIYNKMQRIKNGVNKTTKPRLSPTEPYSSLIARIIQTTSCEPRFSNLTEPVNGKWKHKLHSHELISCRLPFSLNQHAS